MASKIPALHMGQWAVDGGYAMVARKCGIFNYHVGACAGVVKRGGENVLRCVGNVPCRYQPCAAPLAIYVATACCCRLSYNADIRDVAKKYAGLQTLLDLWENI